MVIAGDFKNGVTFDMDGQVMQVIEFQHVKPGKGAAFVRTKLKNVITGAVTETTFNPTDKFQDARIDRREMQYLYNDGDLYYFMDMESFEQLPLNADKLSANFKFVKENDMCKIASYNGNVFAVEPPMFVTLEVTATEPGVRGDTATVRPSRRPSRPEPRSRFRSSSTRAMLSASTPEPESISKELECGARFFRIARMRL